MDTEYGKMDTEEYLTRVLSVLGKADVKQHTQLATSSISQVFLCFSVNTQVKCFEATNTNVTYLVSSKLCSYKAPTNKK